MWVGKQWDLHFEKSNNDWILGHYLWPKFQFNQPTHAKVHLLGFQMIWTRN